MNGQQASPASDLWSLGVTMCAALRRESPFHRSDTQATLAAVLTYEPPPMLRTPRLWPVLAALLRKNPADRPASATFGTALAAVAWPAGSPPEAPTGPVAHAMPTERRRQTGQRVAIPFAAAIIAIVVTALVVVLRPSVHPVGGTARPATTAPTTLPAPPGFEVHEGDGFTVAVPKDWIKERPLDAADIVVT